MSFFKWYTLKDATSGQVHLRLEWLSLLPSADRLTEVSLAILNTKYLIIFLINIWRNPIYFQLGAAKE